MIYSLVYTTNHCSCGDNSYVRLFRVLNISYALTLEANVFRFLKFFENVSSQRPSVSGRAPRESLERSIVKHAYITTKTM